MIPRQVRYVPVVLLVVLVLARIFVPSFLSASPFHDTSAEKYLGWTSWFGITLIILGYLSALVLTPGLLKIIHRLGKWGLIPPAIFLAFLVGGLWLVDITWNKYVDPWCAWCGHSHLLGIFTAAIGGA